MPYCYHDAINDDVMEYIGNEIDLSEWKGRRDDLYEKLNDDLWVEDSVTGNASGSYTFSRAQAKEYVLDNIDLLCEACQEFGTSLEELGKKFFDKDWEWMDVTIRCYLLGEVISGVLDDLEYDHLI